MNRRNLIKTASGLSVALLAEATDPLARAAVPAASSHASGDTVFKVSAQYEYPGVAGQLLVNRPRAFAVLEELRLDGLIALNPINVYYLSNTIPVMTRFRADTPAMATFARDPKEPSFLISSTAEASDLASADREVPRLITVSGVANWQDYASRDPAQMKVEPQSVVSAYVVKQGVPLTPREQRWVEAQRTYNPNSAPTIAWGLVRALKQSGLGGGRVGVDDMRIKLMLDEIGFTGVTCVPAANIFRQIRVIKSEPELALMRVAGRNNALASMNTIKSIQKGMRFEEIERRFQAECAALGNEMTIFLAGIPNGRFPDGHAVPGKPFLVDAVSNFRQYHGDFARTVCIGDPPKDVLDRAQANKIGRDTVFAAVKPGMRFSDIRRIAREAQIQAGMPAQIIIVNPHSVGLEHGDNPVRMDHPYAPPIDTVLEENMVLTIDLPYIEIGWGAGHHEDLIRVTKTGYEALHPEGDPLVVI